MGRRRLWLFRGECEHLSKPYAFAEPTFLSGGFTLALKLEVDLGPETGAYPLFRWWATAPAGGLMQVACPVWRADHLPPDFSGFLPWAAGILAVDLLAP